MQAAAIKQLGAGNADDWGPCGVLETVPDKSGIYRLLIHGQSAAPPLGRERCHVLEATWHPTLPLIACIIELPRTWYSGCHTTNGAPWPFGMALENIHNGYWTDLWVASVPETPGPPLGWRQMVSDVGTWTPDGIMGPCWSPSGARLAYSRLAHAPQTGDAFGAYRLVVQACDAQAQPSGTPHDVTPPGFLFCEASCWVDDDTLIFASDRDQPQDGTLRGDLYALTLSTGAAQNLTSPPGRTTGFEGAWNEHPRVRMQGSARMLSFLSSREAPGGGAELWQAYLSANPWELALPERLTGITHWGEPSHAFPWFLATHAWSTDGTQAITTMQQYFGWGYPTRGRALLSFT